MLAAVLDADETGINKLVSGKRPLEAEMALAIEEVIGIPAETLMEIQKRYELALAKVIRRANPERKTRASLFNDIPVTDMIKRGWLRDVTDLKDTRKVEAELCNFFNVSTIAEIEVLPHAAKRTDVFGDVTPVQLTWLYRVKQMAGDLPAAKYHPAALENALTALKSLLISPDAARKVPRIMMESGVRYVIVESLPAAKIDGVCFWIDDSPVIGMSLRFDRIDNFWFVLRHEIEHVLRGHGKTAIMLDAELEKERAGTGKELSEEERVANEAAAEFCVPRAKLESFIARKAPMFSERDIRGFAATLQVHPGIIAGQLQYQTGRYDLFRNHLVKIRPIVTTNAFSDGWGNVAPVES